MATRSAPLRRTEQKARTREDLKASARRVLARRRTLAISAVARAAGVAAGTFYVHFPSKEALLDELLSDFNDELAARLEPVLLAAAGAPLSTIVDAVAAEFLDHWREHRSFVEAYARRLDFSIDITRLRDGINPPMLALLTMALETAAGARGRSTADTTLLSHALLAMWLRVGLQHLFGPNVSAARARALLVQATVGAVEAVLAATPADEETI